MPQDLFDDQGDDLEARPQRASQLEAMRRGAEESNEREVAMILGEIREARKEVEAALSKLTSLSDDLRTRSRRIPTDAASSLVVFANAHLRFAGAATQGMKRTSAMDRILDRAEAQKAEAKRREEQIARWAEARKIARETEKKVQKLILPPDDAFDELYSEVVSNAE